MTEVTEWTKAYVRQADADFRAWELYQKHHDAVAAPCHELLYLQMACEKLSKAYVLTNSRVKPADVQTSHGFTKKHLPTILRQEISHRVTEKLSKMQEVLKHFRYLAKEIEVLNPAMDRDARPDNCEYPWAAGEKVISPLDWSFTPADLLTRPNGRVFLKTLRLAIDRLLNDLDLHLPPD